MKSAALSFKVSGGWFKNLLRRYWVLPAVAFVIDFCICVLPFLLHLQDLGSMSYKMQDLLRCHGTAQQFLNVGLGLASSLAVFSYLHHEPSVNSVHAMPVKRGHLFNASTLAGLLMVVVPLALTALCFWPVCARMDHLGTDTYVFAPHVPAFGLVNILQASAIYIISNLAAVLTGHLVSHAVLAGILNLLPFGLVATVELFLTSFFKGFQSSNMAVWEKLESWSHPVLLNAQIPLYSGVDQALVRISAGYYLAWIGILLLVALLSAFLYSKIKLEREKDFLVFPFAADLFVALATFASASVAAAVIVGNLFVIPYPGAPSIQKLPFLLAFVPLSLLFFILWRMLTNRTTHVFGKPFWKKFLLYFLIPLAVFPFILFDVTGYQNRIPAGEDIVSARMENYIFHDGVVPFDFGTKSPNYTEAEDLQNIRALHQAAIAEFGHSSEDRFIPTTPITIRYRLKNGRELVRSYEVPAETQYATGKALEALYNGTEARRYNKLNKKELYRSTDKVLFADNTKYSSRIRKADWKDLMTAMNKDIMARSYEDALSLGDVQTQFYNDGSSTLPAPSEKEETRIADLVFLGAAETNAADPLELRWFTLCTGDRNTIEFLLSHSYVTEDGLRELQESDNVQA